MKQCKACGHTNGRLREEKSFYTGRPIPGQYHCVSTRACIRRMETMGKWTGTRVLRRTDRGGTQWTIRRHNDIGLRGLASGPWDSGYVLLCEYRQHRYTTQHATIELAKAHADEMVRSWEANSLSQFASGR